MNAYLKVGLIAVSLSLPLLSDAIAKGVGAGKAQCTQTAGSAILPPYLSRLTLTDAQVTKITEIVNAQNTAQQTKFQEGMAAQDTLRQLIFSEEYTDEQAKTLSTNAAQIFAEASLLRAQMDHAIYLQLTAEQQQQLATLSATGFGFPHH